MGGKDHIDPAFNHIIQKIQNLSKCFIYVGIALPISPVDLPSANGFAKPFAASKFEKLNIENQTVDLRPVRIKSAAFFYPHFQKRRSRRMAKPKTLEQF